MDQGPSSPGRPASGYPSRFKSPIPRERERQRLVYVLPKRAQERDRDWAWDSLTVLISSSTCQGQGLEVLPLLGGRGCCTCKEARKRVMPMAGWGSKEAHFLVEG